MQLYALLLCSVLILLPVFAEPALLQEKDDGNPHQIAKRSVFQLGGEIECLQHKHSFLRTWAFTKYNDYGCFCGIGGMGEPVDETDKCCRAHDNCYDNVNEELEKKQLENPAYKNVQIAKYNGYKYTCTQDGKVECYAQDLYFSLKVCKCDKVLSECLEKSDGTYNENYKHDKNC